MGTRSEADGVDAGAPRSQEFKLLTAYQGDEPQNAAESKGALKQVEADSPTLYKPPPQRLTGKDLDDIPNSDNTDEKSHGEKPSGVQGKLVGGVKAFCTEGHTAWDSLLSNASATVGQVIQVYPHQVALMGIIPAMIVAITTQLLNWYTIWLLVILFLERKRSMIERDTWYDTTDSNNFRRRKKVTQFHDLIGFSMGRFFFVLAEIMVAISLFGTGIAQIVASSSSQYTIDRSHNKLVWALILGPPILVMGLLPSFRSVRIINIIALAGTNYSCLYFFVYGVSQGIKPGIFTRGPQNIQKFFLGFATVAAGGHTFQIEMMDAMRQSRKFAFTSFLSMIWNLMLLVPHSFALVLALPQVTLQQSNIYAALPNTSWKHASVYLMLIHNITAFTLHFNPFLYMWEKLIKVHGKPWYITLPARLPILGILWLVALAAPFYGTINSLFSALTGGMTGYVLPCLAFNWYYRTAERRADCPAKVPWPLNLWGWKPLIFLNYFLAFIAFGGDTVLGILFAIKQLVSDVHTFRWFATCFQCGRGSATG